MSISSSLNKAFSLGRSGLIRHGPMVRRNIHLTTPPKGSANPGMASRWYAMYNVRVKVIGKGLSGCCWERAYLGTVLLFLILDS